jgi:phenylpropionate dioxygenase-like ring-hydroxylating dioxygenase large terminal subunit
MSPVFSEEENQALTSVGPGTLMGDLFREYWIPTMPVTLLGEGPSVKRIRLLGEDLILFRTTGGQLGVIGAYCSHRLAPLFFGRIEEDGIRCPYHGWKYTPRGKCVEMPNVPTEQEFKEDIHHLGYLCVEQGGICWTYMGRSSEAPPFPQFEFTIVPESQRIYRPFRQECNYLQAMEGGIDPTHVMWLHSPYDLTDQGIAAEHQPIPQRLANRSGARTPLAVEIVDTPGGFMYGAKRPMTDGSSLWRVNQFLLPFYTMPPGGKFRLARAWVPMDDTHCVKWDIGWFPTAAIMDTAEPGNKMFFDQESYAPSSDEPYGFICPKANRSNDYLIDWEVHKHRRLGVPGVNLQDICITENEGPTPVLDRTKENLCSGDATIVKARRILLRSAREFRDRGTVPAGIRDPQIYRVRGANAVVPANVAWVEGVHKEVTV